MRYDFHACGRRGSVCVTTVPSASVSVMVTVLMTRAVRALLSDALLSDALLSDALLSDALPGTAAWRPVRTGVRSR
jgi:hypothetical protein